MVAGEVKRQDTFPRLKHQPPGQICPALKKILAEFLDGKSRVRVGLAKPRNQLPEGRGNLCLPLDARDPLPEPFGGFNGNHRRSR